MCAFSRDSKDPAPKQKFIALTSFHLFLSCTSEKQFPEIQPEILFQALAKVSPELREQLFRFLPSKIVSQALYQVLQTIPLEILSAKLPEILPNVLKELSDNLAENSDLGITEPTIIAALIISNLDVCVNETNTETTDNELSEHNKSGSATKILPL